MTNNTADTLASRTAASSPSTTSEPTDVQASRQDPAGGIRLSGRNRMCTRARALAGMVMTSGIVVALGTTDTTSSMHHGFIS